MLRFAMLLFRCFPHGGLQTDFRRILEECIRRGHDVTVFCGAWEGPLPEGARVRQVSCKCLSNHRSALCFQEKVSGLLREENFDLVLGFNRMAGLDLYFAADSCFAAGHRGWFGRIFNPRERIFRRMEKAVFDPRSATRILALTQGQKEQYQDCYGTQDERFILIPPGISRACRRPEKEEIIHAARQQIRREFHIPPHARLLVEIGSSFQTKGVDRNILAMATLPADVHFLVAGREKSSRFRKLAESLNVLDRVHFAGPRDDVPTLLFAADGMVHPARREAAGNALAEAAAAGLPVLCTSVCGYAGIVRAAGGMVSEGEFRQSEWNRLLAEFLAGLEERRRQAVQYAGNADLFRRPEFVTDEMERLCRS